MVPVMTVRMMLSHSTHIFMVPFGPKLLLSTSCNPRAALMLTARAACALATSAFGLSAFTAAMMQPNTKTTACRVMLAGERVEIPRLLETSLSRL